MAWGLVKHRDDFTFSCCKKLIRYSLRIMSYLQTAGIGFQRVFSLKKNEFSLPLRSASLEGIYGNMADTLASDTAGS